MAYLIYLQLFVYLSNDLLILGNLIFLLVRQQLLGFPTQVTNSFVVAQLCLLLENIHCIVMFLQTYTFVFRGYG